MAIDLFKVKKDEVQISEADFQLVQNDQKIFDKKLETKPTTFIKDAFKRFCKNKSSVVGAIILGLLILLAIVVPVVSPYDIETVRNKEYFLAPKLFKAGTGFWDGTRDYTGIVFNTDTGLPTEYDYEPAIVGKVKVYDEPSKIDQASQFGKGGYVVFENQSAFDADKDGNKIEKTNYLYSPTYTFTADGEYKVTIDLHDKEGVAGGKQGEYQVCLVYDGKDDEGNTIKKQLVLTEVTDDNQFITEYDKLELDISAALVEAGFTELKARLQFNLMSDLEQYTYILIEDIDFSSNTEDEELANLEFEDATKMVLFKKEDPQYWTCNGRKGIHESIVYLCDFTYDTYKAVYGEEAHTMAFSNFKTDLLNKNICNIDTTIKLPVRDTAFKNMTPEQKAVVIKEYEQKVIDSFVINNPDKCSISELVGVEFNPTTGAIMNLKCQVLRYMVLGYETEPVFLLGTDVSGHDIVKKAFAGLRTSLILGVCTAAFCFLFGLCWGAISGYFGGNVDLFMERFCDILAGVPSTVVLTLAILHLGNNFGTFVMALCLTGWMGTAGRTRTQFYRFKGREYVLASRTLGSSDLRLIFKHILPNSLGTIITGSVLMIPSVIFSEASLAYLNLGLQGLHSFGVMMSDNQQYLQSYPNLVVFPAVIISLMMISFNLFGNGLRDALNPSLKGSE